MLRTCVGRELSDNSLLAVNGVAGGRFVIFVPDHPDGGVPDATCLEELGRTLGDWAGQLNGKKT